MKKILCMMSLVILSLTADLRAQSDGFFKSYRDCQEEEYDEWGKLLLLPDKHNVDYDYSADSVPLDSSLLIMSGIGVLYANCRKNKR